MPIPDSDAFRLCSPLLHFNLGSTFLELCREPLERGWLQLVDRMQEGFLSQRGSDCFFWQEHVDHLKNRVVFESPLPFGSTIVPERSGHPGQAIDVDIFFLIGRVSTA